jgi:hypothetical protein
MRNLLIIGIVLTCVKSAWALSYMGPMTSQMRVNHWKLGLEYSRAQTSVDLSDFGTDIEDLKTDLYLPRLDYGIYEKMDIYVRLGWAEIEDKGEGIEKMGNELAWGLGIKSTIIESEDLNWGGLVQITSTSGSESTLELEIFEIQLAGGFVWKVNESIDLYGGPFLHWISGEMDIRWLGQTFSSDIEEKSLLGVYAGIAIWATNKGELHLEYQKTADADALGIGIFYPF